MSIICARDGVGWDWAWRSSLVWSGLVYGHALCMKGVQAWIAEYVHVLGWTGLAGEDWRDVQCVRLFSSFRGLEGGMLVDEYMFKWVFTSLMVVDMHVMWGLDCDVMA